MGSKVCAKGLAVPSNGCAVHGVADRRLGPRCIFAPGRVAAQKSTDDHSLPHPHLAPPDLRTHRSVGHSIARQDEAWAYAVSPDTVLTCVSCWAGCGVVWIGEEFGGLGIFHF